MRKKAAMAVCVAMVLGAAGISGCSNSASNPQSTEATAVQDASQENVSAEETDDTKAAVSTDKHYVIGVSQPTMTHPIRQAGNVVIESWKKDHPNVDVFVTDGQLKSDKQIADIEDMIAKKVDAILVAANQSPTLVPVLQEAKDAGIPVIAFDRTLTDKSVEVCEVINDDVTAGKTCAQLLTEGMGETGDIAILEGVSGSSITVERQNGFMDAIKAYPGINIVADQSANYQRVQAVDLFENILQAHPDIKGVFCHNDEMALGVVKVLKDAGITGVTVVGIDGQKDALEAIMAGDMYGTVRKIVELQYALDQTLDYLETGKCEKSILLKSLKVDSGNVKDVYDPNAVF